MKRKLSAAILSLLLCAGTLSGCASGEANTESTEVSVSSDTKVSEASAEAKATLSDDTKSSNAEIVRSEDEALMPVFSLESGFYDAPCEMTITCADPDAKIYFTIDGSVPDENSSLYKAPVNLMNKSSMDNVLSAKTGISAGSSYVPNRTVDKANIIRAAAYYPDGTVSEVTSGTYFIKTKREEKYGDVPVISLITDPDNLFDYEKGIYVLGKTYDDWVAEQTEPFESWQAVGNYSQRGREWERPVTVQLFDSDGKLAFTQDMGVRIMGAASRSSTQKSLRLTARKEYGSKTADYEFIPDNTRSDGNGNVEHYKSIVLRDGGNDCDYAKIRDPLIQKLCADRDFDTQSTTPCVVYIDGEYWGMYTITEDYSDKYIEFNYGIDNKDVIMVKCGEIEEGEEDDISLLEDVYNTISDGDMTDPEKYAEACSLIDMDSFIDYCAMNLYVYNEDGIFQDNNWRMWRVKNTDGYGDIPQADGKWRMIVYDTDYSSGIYSGGGNFRYDNISEFLTYDSKNDDADEIVPAKMFASLYKNPDFKRQLVNTLCDMRNIDFRSSRVISVAGEMYETYSKLVPDTFSRFGPDWVAWQDTKQYYEQKYVELLTFFDGRYDSFPLLMKKAFGLSDPATVEISSSDASMGDIYINGTKLDLSDSSFKGNYFSDYTVTVTAVPSEGHIFSGWDAIGCGISDVSAETAEITLSGDCSITALFE